MLCMQRSLLLQVTECKTPPEKTTTPEGRLCLARANVKFAQLAPISQSSFASTSRPRHELNFVGEECCGVCVCVCVCVCARADPVTATVLDHDCMFRIDFIADICECSAAGILWRTSCWLMLKL